MSLRDRCARQRLRVDAREHVLSELVAHSAFDRGEFDRRHFVDERAQLVDVDVRQQIRA
jgi:hypothetical protein